MTQTWTGRPTDVADEWVVGLHLLPFAHDDLSTPSTSAGGGTGPSSANLAAEVKSPQPTPDPVIPSATPIRELTEKEAAGREDTALESPFEVATQAQSPPLPEFHHEPARSSKLPREDGLLQ